MLREIRVKGDRAMKSFVVSLTTSFLLGLVPVCLHAENPKNVPQIDFLAVDPHPPRDPGFFDAFRQGLRDLGYMEGRDIKIETRFAEGKLDALDGLAKELLALKVDVLVTDSTIATAAAKRATTSVPIVFATTADPVAAGIVPTLGRPGGNITGFAVILSELVGKRLQLLNETFPKIKRVAVISNPRHPAHPPAMQELEKAARILHLNLANFPIGSPEAFEPAFAEIRRWNAEAVFVFDDAFLDFHRERIANLAISARLPSMFGYRLFVDGGGLMSYGPDLADQFRRSAKLVDRILKGAKPGDLPIEQPTKFELAVNLKTASALGLTVPQSILLRADEIIR